MSPKSTNPPAKKKKSRSFHFLWPPLRPIPPQPIPTIDGMTRPRAILKTGFRRGSDGWCGGAIYFAMSPQAGGGFGLVARASRFFELPSSSGVFWALPGGKPQVLRLANKGQLEPSQPHRRSRFSKSQGHLETRAQHQSKTLVNFREDHLSGKEFFPF